MFEKARIGWVSGLVLGMVVGALAVWWFRAPADALEQRALESAVSTSIALESSAATREAQTQAQETANADARARERARELAANARAEIGHDDALAILLAVGTFQFAESGASLSVLRAALLTSPIVATLPISRGVSGGIVNRTGEQVVVQSRNRAQLWEWQSGTLLGEFKGITEFTGVALARDEKWLIETDGNFFASKPVARVWDVRTGEWRFNVPLNGAEYPYRAIAISPDSRWLVVGRGKRIEMWDLANGEMVRSLMPNGVVNGIRFNIAGNLFVTFGKNPVSQVWITDKGVLRSELYGHTAPVNDAAFRGDNVTLVTGSDDRSAIVWNGETGKQVGQVILAGAVLLVRYHLEHFYTASRDGQVTQWTPHTGYLNESGEQGWLGGEHKLGVHAGEITDLVPAPDDRWIASTGADGTLVWDLENDQLLARLPEKMIGRGAKEADGQLRIFTMDAHGNNVHVWLVNRQGRAGAAQWVGDHWHPKPIAHLMVPAQAPENRLVQIAGTARGLMIVNRDTGALWNDYEWGDATDASLTADGKYLAVKQSLFEVATQRRVAGWAGTLYADPVRPLVYEIGGDYQKESGYLVRAHRVPDLTAAGEIRTAFEPRIVRFSPDGKFLALGHSGNLLELLKLPELDEVRLTVPLLHLHDFQFSPDGRWLVVQDDASTLVVDPALGQLVAQLPDARAHLRFSPDSRWLVMAGGCWTRNPGCERTVQVWDTGTWTRPYAGARDFGAYDDVVFSPDSSRVLFVSGTRNIVRDTSQWLPVATLEGKRIVSADFSADGRWLVTAGDDFKPRVWDTAYWVPAMVLPTPETETFQVLFVDAKPTVVTLEADGSARWFTCPVCLEGANLVAQAQQRIPRELTCTERQTYLGEPIACP